MNGFDVAVLAVMVVAILLGLVSGMIRLALGIVSIAAGGMLAIAYADRAAAIAGRYIHAPDLALLVGFITLFALVLLAFALVGWALTRLLHRLGLGWLDRSLGALTGAACVLAAASVAALVLRTYVPESRLVRGSRALPRLAEGALWGKTMLPVRWREEGVRLAGAARARWPFGHRAGSARATPTPSPSPHRAHDGGK